jgi:hypothetical protein
MILVQHSHDVHKNEVRHAWLQVFQKESETKLTTYVLFKKFIDNFPLQYSKLYSYLSPTCLSTHEKHHLAVNSGLGRFEVNKILLKEVKRYARM